MILRFLSVLWLCAAAFTAVAQATYMRCDFEHGIPADFTLYDVDNLEPSVDAAALGFAQGKAWISLYLDAEASHVAASTSWYKTAGTSNDWMVTAPINVDSEKAIFSWVAKAADRKFRDGYSVYISTQGNKVEDFTSPAVFTTAAEENVWQKRQVSLADYCGQTIWVAIVNDSHDKSRLYIDDLYAGVPSRVYLMTNEDRLPYEGEVTISGYAYTELESPVVGFQIGLVAEGDTLLLDYPDQVLEAGQRFPFEFDRRFFVKARQPIDYSVWIASGGDHYQQDSRLSAYVQRVLAEESTGQWCAWCVRGIVNMERMHQNHPETFIGVAVHNDDQMTYSYYDKQINVINNGGFPKAIVNRNPALRCDPGLLEDAYQSVMAAPSFTDLALEAEVDTVLQEVSVSCSVMSADLRDSEKYRLSYIVIENNIHRPDDPAYYQNNAYAGGSNGEMGGYEEMPKYIPAADMWFQEVGRWIADETFCGIDGSLPQVLEPDVVYAHDYKFSVSEATIFDYNELEVIAVMVDQSNGLVLNSVCCKPYVIQASGLETITTDGANADYYTLQGARISADTLPRGQILVRNGRKVLLF